MCHVTKLTRTVLWTVCKISFLERLRLNKKNTSVGGEIRAKNPRRGVNTVTFLKTDITLYNTKFHISWDFLVSLRTRPQEYTLNCPITYKLYFESLQFFHP